MRMLPFSVLLMTTLSAAAGAATAQDYPVKPVRMIVASPPGGSPDILARTLSQRLSENLGQQVVDDNRAGASGIIGTEIAAQAAADGHTLFFGTSTLYAILPVLKTNLRYDITRDFSSITQVASASNVLVINPSVAAKSVAELVQLAKARPGALNYASAGRGTPAHLAGEMLNVTANIRMTHVPYKGAGPALLDVIAGQVQLIMTSPIAAGPHISSGKVRALATTGPRRNPALPDLPTIAETVPGYEITQWWGLSVPAKTPRAIVGRLHAETVKVLNLPEIRDRILRSGATPVGNKPQEFDAFIAAERRRISDLIRKAKITLDD